MLELNGFHHNKREVIEWLKNIWKVLSWPFIGMIAFFWVVLRVIQKPSRATYPCVQAAIPFASGFVVFLGLTLQSIIVKKMRKRVGVFTVFVALLVGINFLAPHFVQPSSSSPFIPVDLPNTPVGVARGINPGRVVWTYAPEAVIWDGMTGRWWDDDSVDQDIIDYMLSQSLQSLTSKGTDKEAWNSLFEYFNYTRGKGKTGYEREQRVAIKLNMNNSGQYRWDHNTNLNHTPHFVLALLRQLVNEAGVSEDMITLTDPSRIIGHPIYEKCIEEFPNVLFVDREGAHDIIKAVPDMSAPIYYADSSVQYSGKAYITKCFIEADYIINVALLKGHELAGITLGAKNHFGSMWTATGGNWSPAHLHEYIAIDRWREFPKREMGTYNPLVELMGHKHLDGKTMLFIIEGLYAAHHQNGGR